MLVGHTPLVPDNSVSGESNTKKFSWETKGSLCQQDVYLGRGGGPFQRKVGECKGRMRKVQGRPCWCAGHTEIKATMETQAGKARWEQTLEH